MKTITRFWIGLGILAILSPLGILLPQHLKAGAAWGEWGTDEVKGLVGYIPAGLENLSAIWKAAFPDYAFHGWEDKGLGHTSFAYIVSALIGIALCVAGAWLLGRFLTRQSRKQPNTPMQTDALEDKCL